jgi:hypothetical protein
MVISHYGDHFWVDAGILHCYQFLVFRFGCLVLSVYGIESDAASLSRARTPSKYLLYSLLASVLPWLLRRVCPSLVVNFARTSFGSVVHASLCLYGAFVCRTPRRRLAVSRSARRLMLLWSRKGPGARTVVSTRTRPPSASSFTSTSKHSSARPRLDTRMLSSSGLAGTRSCPKGLRLVLGSSTSRFASRCLFVLCVLVLVCLAGALYRSWCCSRGGSACARRRFRPLSSLDCFGPRDVSGRELRSRFGAVFAAFRPLDLAGALVSLVGSSQGEGGLLPRGASSLGEPRP